LVDEMTRALLSALELSAGAEVIGLVNGLGSVTQLELYGIFRELVGALDRHGVTLARHLVGNFVAALDMRGFSLCLLVADEPTLALWDAPARTAAWQSDPVTAGGQR